MEFPRRHHAALYGSLLCGRRLYLNSKETDPYHGWTFSSEENAMFVFAADRPMFCTVRPRRSSPGLPSSASWPPSPSLCVAACVDRGTSKAPPRPLSMTSPRGAEPLIWGQGEGGEAPHGTAADQNSHGKNYMGLAQQILGVFVTTYH